MNKVAKRIARIIFVTASFLSLVPFCFAYAATTTMGEATVLSSTDSGNANLLLVQNASLAQPGTLRSVSFYVKSAAGNLRLGVYDASGAGGGPGILVGQTGVLKPVVGWNTATVTPVSLAPGNYWLAYLPSSNSLQFAASFTTGSFKFANFTFASMPATFPAIMQQGTSHWSLYASLDIVTDTTPPSVPTNLSAAALSSSAISLAWATSTDNIGVTGYSLSRNGVPIATTTATTFTDTGLTASTLYTYAVRAFDAAKNYSAFSASTSTSTLATPPPDTTPPSVPTGLTSSLITTHTLTVSWNASTDTVGVSGYQLFRNGTQIATTTTTSFSDTGLTASTTYSYTVTAFDAARNISAASAAFLVTTSAQPALVNSVKVSTSGPYLLDQNNQPFLIVGDSPHSILSNLSESEMDTYLADRAAQGFNTLWVEVLTDGYVSGDSDGLTYDGIRPFLVGTSLATYDMSTPNPAYFQRLDDFMNMASSHGITVMLDSFETAGWMSTAESNGNTKLYNFGAYLGNRYRGYSNLIWIMGNDFQTWNAGTIDNTLMKNLMAGIADNDPNHIQTTELNYEVSGSLDDALLRPYTALAGAYTYLPTYDEVLNQYNAGGGTVPVFLEEEHYENEAVGGCCGESGTPGIIRRQAYWTVLAGGLAGHLYGNSYTWTFSPGWQSNLDTPGAANMHTWKNFFTSIPWYTLVPDQTHQIVTAGYGTYNATGALGTNTYATTAGTRDGSLAVTYTPKVQTLTVNMNFFAGPVTAQWFDPSNGTYANIVGSPFTNSGTRTFTPPGNNAGGDTDWVLLMTAAIGPDTTPPSVPAGLSGVANSQSRISLSWNASSDKSGVSGYQVFRNGMQIATSSSTNYVDTGLSTSTTYTYAVDAFDVVGNISAVSSSTVITTLAGPDTTAPSVPTNLTVSGLGNTQVTVSWTASSDNILVSGYQVFRNGTQIATTTTTSFSDTGLTASTTYSYTVTAFDSAGNVSAQSASLLVTTTAQPFTMGETSVFSADDNGNGNLLLVQDVALPKAGTLQSLSFDVTAVSGNLRLGLYDATGSGGGPGQLVAQTNSFTPIAGWNTQNVLASVRLAAGNYWLAYFPSSNSLHFPVNNTIGSFRYANLTFGAMPQTFPAIVGSGITHWSLYGTLTP